ncbi:MAG: YqaJ viral recombinase family protein [Candidatus Dojkabacteria bacterium]
MISLNDINFVTREEYSKWCEDTGARAIGGSDVAGIIDKSKWSSRFSIWKDKLFGRDKFKTQYMIDGIELEDSLLETFLNDNPEFELADKCDNKLVIHPDYPFMVSAIDAILRHKESGELYLMEIKTTNAYNRADWEGGIPDYYYTQVLHYANCTGIDKSILYVSIRDGANEVKNDYYLLTEESTPSYHDTKQYLIDEIVSFWNTYVITQNPPLLDGSKPTERALGYLNENEIDITASFRDMRNAIPKILEARNYYDTLLKEVTEIKKNLDTIIKGYVGFGTKEINGYKLSYKTYSTNKFDTASFREDNPDLYNRYITQNSYQRFTVTKKKGVIDD